MADPTKTLFIVDDDEAIRTSLTRSLGMRGYQVESYASACDFLATYDGSNPGCLILDQGMPGMTGLELQAHLTRLGQDIPIIFITGHGGVPESVQAMKGGAVDFLEKPFPQSVLLERIEAALAQLTNNLANAAKTADLRQKFDRLTARELELVDHILANPSQISSKEIGRTLGISPRTVDHHRARILEKLQVRSVAEMIDLAARGGR